MCFFVSVCVFVECAFVCFWFCSLFKLRYVNSYVSALERRAIELLNSIATGNCICSVAGFM